MASPRNSKRGRASTGNRFWRIKGQLQLLLLSVILSLLSVSVLCDASTDQKLQQHQRSKRQWLSENKQPEYLFLDNAHEGSSATRRESFESELNALEELRAIEEAARQELAYNLENQASVSPEETIILENGQTVTAKDAAQLGLGRFLARHPVPVLSLSEQQQQQPIEYPQSSAPSWPSHQYSVVGLEDEGKLPLVDRKYALDSYGPKLAELLDDEQQQLINSLALLDSPQAGSFDDDNATYSNVKTPSYTPLTDQAPAETKPTEVSGKQTSTMGDDLGLKVVRANPPTTTLLTDEDFAEVTAPKSTSKPREDSTGKILTEAPIYGTIIQGPKGAEEQSQLGVKERGNVSSLMSRVFGQISEYLPFLKHFLPEQSKSNTNLEQNLPFSLSQKPAKQAFREITGATDKRGNTLDQDNKSSIDKKKLIVDDQAARKLMNQAAPLDKMFADEPLEVSESQMHRYLTDSVTNLDDIEFLKNQHPTEHRSSSLRHSILSFPELTAFNEVDREAGGHSSSLSKKDVDEFDNSGSIGPSHVRNFKTEQRLYGAYPSAARLETPVSFNDNKTNDLYFLVMVAAFCAMAMAVVLSAGLFAYRIQQNRAAAADTDYPTYGVVGPNNMSAKCGAGGLAGSHFMSGSFFGHGTSLQPTSLASGGSVKSGLGGKLNGLKSGKDMLSSLGSHSDSGVVVTSTTPGVESLMAKRASSSTGPLAPQHANGAGNYPANQNAARMYHYQHQKQQMMISDHSSVGGRHTSASDLDSEDENDDGSYTVYECPGLASAHEMEIKNPLFNDDRSP